MNERRARVWPLRLIEFSPLVIAALIIALWTSMPDTVRARILFAEEYQGRHFGESRSDVVDRYAAAFEGFLQSEGGDASIPDPVSDLRSLATFTWLQLRDRIPDPDESGRFAAFSLSGETELERAIRSYERHTGSRVFVYLAPGLPDPSVAFAEISAPGLLTDEERAQIASGTATVLRSNVLGSLAEPRPIAVESLEGASGIGDATRSATIATRVAYGRLWEFIGLTPATSAWALDIPASVESPSGSGRFDMLGGLARRAGGDLVVVGPVDAPLVPLRFARGTDATDASRLAERIWPERYARDGDTQPFSLSAAERALVGGSPWAMTAIAGGTTPAEDTAAAQAILLIATYEDDPRGVALMDALADDPWRGAKIVLAANFTSILTGLIALFVISLAASPLAFMQERRQSAEEDFERELERLQEEANERVVHKLAELSDEIARAARSADSVPDELAEAQTRIAEISADLRSLIDRPAEGRRRARRGRRL